MFFNEDPNTYSTFRYRSLFESTLQTRSEMSEMNLICAMVLVAVVLSGHCSAFSSHTLLCAQQSFAELYSSVKLATINNKIYFGAICPEKFARKEVF